MNGKSVAIIFNCISKLFKIKAFFPYKTLSVVTVILFTANGSSYIGSLTMSDSHISLQFLLMLLPACKLQLCVCMCGLRGLPMTVCIPGKSENISLWCMLSSGLERSWICSFPRLYKWHTARPQCASEQTVVSFPRWKASLSALTCSGQGWIPPGYKVCQSD